MTDDLDFDADHKTVDLEPIKSARPWWQKLLFFAGLILLIALLIFGASKLLSSNEESESDKTATSSATPEATGSAEKTSDRCQPDKELVNEPQGYSVCFVSAWSAKETKPSGMSVSLGTKEPTENDPGLVVISITDQSAELVIQTFNDNSSKFEFGTDVIDGKKVTQTTITRSKSDPLSTTYPRAILTATTINNRTYVATLNSSETDFATNQTLYTNLLQSWEFLDDISKPPWSDSRNIIVYQPWPDDTVNTSMDVSGEALSLEATVSVRVKDADGKILTETSLKTASSTTRSAFSGKVNFDKPKTKTGTVEIYNTSDSGADQDKVVIPVTFQ